MCLDAMSVDERFPMLDRWSKTIDRMNPYMGERYDKYFIVIGHNRNSRSLSESNFYSMCEAFADNTPIFRGGAEVKLPATERLRDGVIVVSASHWLVGWVEFVLVHETAIECLEIAANAHTRLEDYPILDDLDFSNRICDVISEFCEEVRNDLENELENIQIDDEIDGTNNYQKIVNGGYFEGGKWVKVKPMMSRRWNDLSLTATGDEIYNHVDARYMDDEYD